MGVNMNLMEGCIKSDGRGAVVASLLKKANEGRCCDAGVIASAVFTIKSLKVLSRLIAKKAESVKSERMVKKIETLVESVAPSVRIRSALPFQNKGEQDESNC